MRIKINFTQNTSPVPIDNQHLLNGYIHKCLGKDNKYHDTWSNYSISTLLGGKLNKDSKTLSFKDGAFITVTSEDREFLNLILMGTLDNKELFNGMKFAGFDHVEEKFNNGVNHFVTLFPGFIIKEPCPIHGERFIQLSDKDFDIKVKNYLIKKLKRIDESLDLKDFDVKIEKRDWYYTKKVKVGKSFNISNMCQLDIRSSKEIAKLIYNIGVGKSTGSGFGAIAKTESNALYFKNK